MNLLPVLGVRAGLLLRRFGGKVIYNADARVEVSPKSFGVAVALCMIFGISGVHHFYLGNWLHGLFDFGLLVLAVVLFAYSDPSAELFAIIVLAIDYIHTLIVAYKLFTGACRDGQGRIVAYPGQRF